MIFAFDAPEMSRDAPFQHPKLISSEGFDVCRLSKPSPILTMVYENGLLISFKKTFLYIIKIISFPL